MEAILSRCCGLDVHQATVVACLLVGQAGTRPTKEVRTFRTVTRDLVELRDWLLSEGCTHVAMESTGIYWIPVYAVLEGSFDLVVGNAQHIKNVPGRKTDIKDSEWLADLLRHGLIAKSFVPPQPIRELRDIMRFRRKLVQSRAAERNRLLKLIEIANIKLSSVVTDVFGVSGRAMLKALVLGTTTPAEMAQLAKGRLRKKVADLELALEGKLEVHHRLLMQTQLERIEQVDAQIIEIDKLIEQRLQPYHAMQLRLIQIPGVDFVTSAHILAEIGADMSVFGSPQRLASWAGVCPGNHESAGKRKRGTSRKGNVHLTVTLVEAAQAAVRTRGSYYRDKFYRLKSRRGYKRAILAIAHKILVTVYHLLSTGNDYRELGETYLDRLDQRRAANNLVRRLQRLGYEVQVQEPTS